jgi:hypothetical protein
MRDKDVNSLGLEAAQACRRGRGQARECGRLAGQKERNPLALGRSQRRVLQHHDVSPERLPPESSLADVNVVRHDANFSQLPSRDDTELTLGQVSQRGRDRE